MTSGVPSAHAVLHFGCGGRSVGSPSGAPLAIHVWSALSSASVSRRSPSNGPLSASGFQGGMMRRAVASLICVRCRFTSSYVTRLNGPISPERWHVAQRDQTIGATSLVNVRGGGAAACAGADPARKTTAHATASPRTARPEPFGSPLIWISPPWASIPLLRKIEPRAALTLLLVFTLALAVRLIHVWQLRRSPFFDVLMGDSRGYDEWA